MVYDFRPVGWAAADSATPGAPTVADSASGPPGGQRRYNEAILATGTRDRLFRPAVAAEPFAAREGVAGEQ